MSRGGSKRKIQSYSDEDDDNPDYMFATSAQAKKKVPLSERFATIPEPDVHTKFAVTFAEKNKPVAVPSSASRGGRGAYTGGRGAQTSRASPRGGRANPPITARNTTRPTVKIMPKTQGAGRGAGARNSITTTKAGGGGGGRGGGGRGLGQSQSQPVLSLAPVLRMTPFGAVHHQQQRPMAMNPFHMQPGPGGVMALRPGMAPQFAQGFGMIPHQMMMHPHAMMQPGRPYPINVAHAAAMAGAARMAKGGGKGGSAKGRGGTNKGRGGGRGGRGGGRTERAPKSVSALDAELESYMKARKVETDAAEGGEDEVFSGEGLEFTAEAGDEAIGVLAE